MCLRRVLPLLVLVCGMMAGCASDPTTSDEYVQLEASVASLEAELAAVEAQLSKVTSERDSLAASEDLTAEQAQMIETIGEYLAAWNAGDGAAADALMDPNGYLEDVGGRWYVDDGSHSRYLETLHATGFPINRSEDFVVVGNVVVLTHTYAEGSTFLSPNIYYMYPDGTKIWWVHEPYPLNLP